MKTVINTEKRPIKLWLDDIEAQALAQARNLANLPFTYKHVAIMADAHPGYGMPIGGVLATEGAVIPNAVGVDIGCGMCAVKTSLSEIDQDTLKKILGSRKSNKGIRATIPVGFKHHKVAQEQDLMPDLAGLAKVKRPQVVQLFQAGLKQLGTLGGGNHFIEIQQGDDGYIWLMIHSGSRNIGYKIAGHYNKLAIKMNEKWQSSIPPKWQLAFLPLDSAKAWDYMAEMQYCVNFAYANRKLGLDEQAMLLRAIEEKRFLAVGADQESFSEFQLICGTNRDLQKECQQGSFREDLLARINLWIFAMPGLAQRPEDIEPNLRPPDLRRST